MVKFCEFPSPDFAVLKMEDGMKAVLLLLLLSSASSQSQLPTTGPRFTLGSKSVLDWFSGIIIIFCLAIWGRRWSSMIHFVGGSGDAD